MNIVKMEYGVDLLGKAKEQSKRPIVELFLNEIKDFSKYKLAKAYVRWTRSHTAEDLDAEEVPQWEGLIGTINKVLK